MRLLSGNAALLAEERRRVRHLLIDEYQDTNTSQDALVKLFGEGADSLCAVGDEDQAIYRWRGAEVEHILHFEEDFPGARVVALESNYRSTAKILSAAAGLVSHNRRRREKRLRADRGAGAAVRLWRFEEDRAETEAVGREIASSGKPPGEMAILYRTNAQSRPFEEELVRRRIPYVVVGGMKFYERAEVKDVLAYLRLAARPEDDLAFRRVVNVPARGIGAATLDRLAAAARESGRSWWEVSENPAGLTERARTALARFREVVLDLHEKSATWTPSALLEHLLSVTGYAALYEGSEDREDVARRENIEELLSSAREFERRNEEGATIAEYLDTVALATDADSAASGGAVTLSTLHAAKGLEFATVFAVGLEEGYLPHGQSAEDEDELEEERRLLYVGMTRAKDSLTLTLADRRMVYGRIEPRRPSRFVEEIPKAALEEQYFGRPAPTIFAARDVRGRAPGRPPAAPRQARAPPALRLRRHPHRGRLGRGDAPDGLLRPRRQEEVRRPLRGPDAGVRAQDFRLAEPLGATRDPLEAQRRRVRGDGRRIPRSPRRNPSRRRPRRRRAAFRRRGSSRRSSAPVARRPRPPNAPPVAGPARSPPGPGRGARESAPRPRPSRRAESPPSRPSFSRRPSVPRAAWPRPRPRRRPPGRPCGRRRRTSRKPPAPAGPLRPTSPPPGAAAR